MGKMSEMAETIADLRTAAAFVNEAADWLARQLGSTPEKETEPTLEQVRAVLADKSRRGFTAEIRDLLKKYGAGKLSEVDPGSYRALLREAEELDHAT